MADHEIYRQQLALTFPTYGYALWDPSPTQPAKPVEVGDVGFIRWGKFHRLFNALLSADDPSQGLGVPEHHEPLVPNLSDHINKGSLSCGHYCSSEISVEPEPDVRASGPDDVPQVSYICPRKRQGALLSLPVKARRKNTLTQGDFGEWMLKHIDRCFAFARRLGLGIEQMEEIILATGCDLTRSWTNVAFLGGHGDAQVSFGVKAGNGPGTSIGFQFSPGHVRGAVLNQGPEGTDLPENQCVFIRGFRVARPLKILPRHLKAAAGPSSDPEAYDREPGMELLSIPGITKYRDPLYLLQDYIAERTPDCDMVLIHDDDLEKVNGNGEATTLQPDMLVDLFRMSNIEIHGVDCDLSQTGNSSNTDTDVVRVAMLSTVYKNWSIALQSQVSPFAAQNNDLSHANDSSVSIIPDSSLVPIIGNRSDSLLEDLAKNVLGQDSLRDAPLWDDRPWCAQREAAHPKHRGVDGGTTWQVPAWPECQLGMGRGTSLPRPVILIEPLYPALWKYPIQLTSVCYPGGDGFIHQQGLEGITSPRIRLLQSLKGLIELELPNHSALVETGPQFGAHQMRAHTMREDDSHHTEPLRSTPPPVAKVATQSPTSQSVKVRTPDRSLPVQEEPEEDGAYEQYDKQEQERDRWTPGGSDYGRHGHRHEQDLDRQHPVTLSPTSSPDLLPEGFDPCYDARHERIGRENLGQKPRRDSNDAKPQEHESDEDKVQRSGCTQSQDEESYTPRSPPVLLPSDRSLARYPPAPSQQRQHSQHSHPWPPRIRSRNGAIDSLGLRSFDTASFGNTLEQLKPLPEQNLGPYPAPQVKSPHQVNSPHQIHSPNHEEPSHFLDDPAAAYYQNYPQSPVATHSHTSAPIPPTPHSHIAAPSTSPLVSGTGLVNGAKPVLPLHSPVPPVGSPYPYPFGHIRRGQTYSGSYNGTMDHSQMDPYVVREQLAMQMHIYALSNGGMVSDSTLSPSSTPFPGPHDNPWAFLRTSNIFGGRRGIPDSSASIRSSPSHQPVSLPSHARPSRGLRRRERSQNLRRRAKIRAPPRVESIQPRDTRPELSSNEEETDGESKVGDQQSEPRRYVPQPARWDASADDEDKADADDGEWVDEEIGNEGVADDMLQLEFHTDYVSNPEKRRRRWKVRWEALLRAFNALDRETDTTLVLLAAPAHTSKLHSMASRAIRRDSDLLDSADMMSIRSGFAEVAARRRASRSASLLEQLSRASSSPRDGLPSSSSESREEDLRRALDTAIGSLHALGSLYEQREMRWIEEKHRLDEDREKVQLLLKQVLGVGVVGNLVVETP